MRVNPYGEEPVRLAVELVNNPPSSLEELLQRCSAVGILVPEGTNDDEMPKLDAVMTRWLRVVDSPPGTARAGVLNELLAASTTHPMLTDHAGTEWHLHYRPEHASLTDVLASMIYVGTALLLTGRGMHRLGRCEVQECTRVFVDISRPGTQRHCSVRCANRNAVRRHRAAQHFVLE